jgi:hypothetical protein
MQQKDITIYEMQFWNWHLIINAYIIYILHKEKNGRAWYFSFSVKSILQGKVTRNTSE